MQKRFGKVTTLEARFHPFNDSMPEIFSAFGVDSDITDHRKLMRHRSDKNQYGVPQRSPIHFQLCETMASRTERVARLFSADEHAYLTAGSFFGGGNG
jgi:hypothetical protein